MLSRYRHYHPQKADVIIDKSAARRGYPPLHRQLALIDRAMSKVEVDEGLIGHTRFVSHCFVLCVIRVVIENRPFIVKRGLSFLETDVPTACLTISRRFPTALTACLPQTEASARGTNVILA